ncbi:MAG: hypothetical protein KF866_08300 [Phycisphaeraceae bacterium]|nr:hypothetical protein [Phycisphaeraceae bacterium]MCW5753877.1 hypothetical protein [Phycisphaeraceae bacterium]
MAVSISRAKTLCTAPEFALVSASSATAVKAMSADRLRDKIARARKLRDKYRDLAERQRRESRGKQSPRGKRPSQSNEATQTKQQIFAEAMERFQTALTRLEGASASPNAKATTPAKPKASKKRAKRRSARAETKAIVESIDASKTPVSGRRRAGKGALSRKAKSGHARAAATDDSAVTSSPATKKPSRRRSVAELTPGKTPPTALHRNAVTPRLAAEKTSLQVRDKASVGKRKADRVQASGTPRIGGHIKASGRRNQAKRDSRPKV